MNASCSQIVCRVATRHVRGAFFSIGDIIYFGKYKNKRGKIVSFSKNNKDQPVVEIEPIPKGRKQNKTMGLFKIWHGTKADEAKARIEAEKEEEKAKAEAKAEGKAKTEGKAKKEAMINPHTSLPLSGLKLTAMTSEQRKLYTDFFQLGPMTTTQSTAEVSTVTVDYPTSMAERVARRFTARGVPLGKHVDSGDVRIHRYRDQFFVWDLTNAGKRGKKVRRMSISPSYSYSGNADEWMERMAGFLPNYRTYNEIRSFMRDLLVDYPGEINIDEDEERGVDVNPGGTRTIEFKTNTDLEVRAEPNEFRVLHRWEIRGRDGKPTGNHQDETYYSRKRLQARRFYNWLQANEAQAKRMDIADFRKLWTDLKIQYDFH